MAKAAPATHQMIGGGVIAGMSREERVPQRRHVRSLRIEKAKNGGHTITHEYNNDGPGQYNPPVTHSFGPGQHKQVLDHIKKHIGINTAIAAAKGRAAMATPEPDGDEAEGA